MDQLSPMPPALPTQKKWKTWVGLGVILIIGGAVLVLYFGKSPLFQGNISIPGGGSPPGTVPSRISGPIKPVAPAENENAAPAATPPEGQADSQTTSTPAPEAPALPPSAAQNLDTAAREAGISGAPAGNEQLSMAPSGNFSFPSGSSLDNRRIPGVTGQEQAAPSDNRPSRSSVFQNIGAGGLNLPGRSSPTTPAPTGSNQQGLPQIPGTMRPAPISSGNAPSGSALPVQNLPSGLRPTPAAPASNTRQPAPSGPTIPSSIIGRSPSAVRPGNISTVYSSGQPAPSGGNSGDGSAPAPDQNQAPAPAPAREKTQAELEAEARARAIETELTNTRNELNRLQNLVTQTAGNNNASNNTVQFDELNRRIAALTDQIAADRQAAASTPSQGPAPAAPAPASPPPAAISMEESAPSAAKQTQQKKSAQAKTNADQTASARTGQNALSADAYAQANANAAAANAEAATNAAASSDAAKRLHGAYIQGRTGPGILVYPVALALANGAFYLARRRRKQE